MSESNRVALRYVAESTFGQTPAGPPTLKNIRRTGGTFTPGVSQITSSEVRADRMIADLIRTGINPSASIDFEQSYGAHHDLYEGVFMNTWASAESTTGSLTTVKASKTVTMTGAFTNLDVGDWFEIEDSADNDGFYRILTKTSNDEVVTETDEAFGADATAEASVTIKNDGRLTMGTTRKSFSMEEEYADETQFMAYRGVVLGSMTLNIQAEQIVTGSFGDILAGSPDPIGANQGVVERRGTTIGDGSPTAAPSNSVAAAVSDVLSIRENSALNNYLVQALSISINNNLRARTVVGHVGTRDVRLGTGNVNGAINVYWGSNAEQMVDRLIGDTASSHSFRVTDNAGNTEIWTIPALKFESGGPEAGGLDADVMTNMGWRAFLPAVTAHAARTMVQVDRFAA